LTHCNTTAATADYYYYYYYYSAKDNRSSGVAMGWAGWAKSRGPPSEGAPEFQANF